jgi:hypothetical protein
MSLMSYIRSRSLWQLVDLAERGPLFSDPSISWNDYQKAAQDELVRRGIGWPPRNLPLYYKLVNGVGISLLMAPLCLFLLVKSLPILIRCISDMRRGQLTGGDIVLINFAGTLLFFVAIGVAIKLMMMRSARKRRVPAASPVRYHDGVTAGRQKSASDIKIPISDWLNYYFDKYVIWFCIAAVFLFLAYKGGLRAITSSFSNVLQGRATGVDQFLVWFSSLALFLILLGSISGRLKRFMKAHPITVISLGLFVALIVLAMRMLPSPAAAAVSARPANASARKSEVKRRTRKKVGIVEPKSDAGGTEQQPAVPPSDPARSQEP